MADFDHWSQRGNPGWNYEETPPYFRRSERNIGEADEHYRGRDGELPITDLDWHHPVTKAFVNGAKNFEFLKIQTTTRNGRMALDTFSVGMPVVHELPGADSHLRDHYGIRLVSSVKGICTINNMARGTRLLLEIARWLVRKPTL